MPGRWRKRCCGLFTGNPTDIMQLATPAQRMFVVRRAALRSLTGPLALRIGPTSVAQCQYHGTAHTLASLVVTVPTMGESITGWCFCCLNQLRTRGVTRLRRFCFAEGTVIEWVKKTGDTVGIDDVVVVIETDKVEFLCCLCHLWLIYPF